MSSFPGRTSLRHDPEARRWHVTAFGLLTLLLFLFPAESAAQTLHVQNGAALTLGGNATIDLGTATMLEESSGGHIDGYGAIQATRVLDAPTGMDVAGLGFVLDSDANLGEMIVRRLHGPPTESDGQVGIQRAYEVSMTENTTMADFAGTAQLHYREDELNRIPEADLHPGVALWDQEVRSLTVTLLEGQSVPDQNYVQFDKIVDLFGIFSAYGQQAEPAAPTPPIAAVPEPETAEPGDLVAVDVVAGTPDTTVSDLFGVGFELRYDTTRLAYRSVAAGAFIDDGDLLETSSADSNVVAYSVSRKSGAAGVSGSGPVARLTFEVRSDAPAGSAPFKLRDLLATDANSQQLTLNPRDSFLGVVPAPQIWPGDTDNSGPADSTVAAVTADDLFPLANCFGLEGAARNPDSLDLSWAAQTGTRWGFPDGDDLCTSATTDDPAFVDATGDGEIDQNDLLAVGANFGRTLSGGVSGAVLAGKMVGEPLASVDLGAVEADDLVELDIDLVGASDYFGLSVELATLPELFEIEEVVAGAAIAVEEGSLLEVTDNDRTAGHIAAALSRKRGNEPVQASDQPVLTLHLRARSAQSDVVRVDLTRATLNMGGAGTKSLQAGDVQISSDRSVATDGPPSLPQAVALHGNAPNPFSSSTTIRYDLPEPRDVRIDVYDTIGRRITTLVDGRRPAGRHDLRIDGAQWPAGVYLVRLQAGGHVETRRIVRVQ